jgi:uncharacterized membrane protein
MTINIILFFLIFENTVYTLITASMASHSDKFLTKILLGFACVIASIFVIVYACFERVKYDDWYGWGLVASVLMCVGIYLSLSAFVHKVKADFMRRQKSKELQEKKYSDKD